MDTEAVEAVIAALVRLQVEVLDLTGGAPELNRYFCRLVETARSRGMQVIDRCNLTVLEVPEQASLAEFLARQQVEIYASLPCYLAENVDRQRGAGMFDASIRGLQKLNALGGGQPGSGLTLNLVYNRPTPELPPAQASLEVPHRTILQECYGHSIYPIGLRPTCRSSVSVAGWYLGTPSIIT